MKKFLIYGGIVSYFIFSIIYIIYGYFNPHGQQILAHVTGGITLLTLMLACLLEGFNYCQVHKWRTLCGFFGCGLMALAYFMYTFLGITAENSVVSSLLFDLSSTLVGWRIIISVVDKILRINPDGKKK